MLYKTRQFAVGVLVTLYQIDLTALGGTKHYFTNHVFEERVPIKFGGHTYVALPISMDSAEVDSQGAPPQPMLSIATSGGPLAALISNYNDLRNAVVTRFDTFAEFLDTRPTGIGADEPNPNADPAAIMNLDMFVIDRKQSADDVFAEFQLVAPTDQEGVMLPLRIVRKRWCDSQYRVQDATQPDGFFYFEPVDGGCPWAGNTYFDVNDQPCTQAEDRCSKMVTGCVLRFGKSVALPMTAMPGIRAAQEA